MMRVGISIGSTVFGEGSEAQRDGPRFVLEQARAAARAGLDTLTLGDHHSTGPVGYMQNVPMLARILAEWQDRQAGCLFLLPLWHPVLMAEQVGTLATMADGPFIVQIGGGGDAGQFRAMGVRLEDRGSRLEDGLRIAQALLSGETVTSDTYSIDSACIAPLPPDGTKWWLGGGVARAIERAARLGDCWYANADLTPETAARDMQIYRAACARHGRDPVRIPIRKDVFVSESRAEGERVGDELVGAGYRGLAREAVAYGDPASVAEQLAAFADLGFTDAIIRTMWPLPPGFGAAAAHRSVELAGEVRVLLSK